MRPAWFPLDAADQPNLPEGSFDSESRAAGTIRLASRAALSRTTGACGAAASVLAFEVLRSLRSGLSGLSFAIQILKLAGLTRVLACTSRPLAGARLSAPLRAGIRLRGCRLSARLPT